VAPGFPVQEEQPLQPDMSSTYENFLALDGTAGTCADTKVGSSAKKKSARTFISFLIVGIFRLTELLTNEQSVAVKVARGYALCT
jgi:hypothetical protein